MKYKKCTKCLINKDKNDFGKDKTKHDGLYSSCKQCRKEQQQTIEYKTKYRLYHIEYNKKHYQKNKNQIKKRHQKYYQNNKTNILKQNNLYQKKKYATDPLFRTKHLLRRRIYHASKGINYAKKSTTEKILGCSYLYFLQYIESLFTEGMSWDNQGQWHIDHITPLASAKNQKDIEKLCHYTNLQPLWAMDNLKKNSKIPKHHL